MKKGRDHRIEEAHASFHPTRMERGMSSQVTRASNSCDEEPAAALPTGSRVQDGVRRRSLMARIDQRRPRSSRDQPPETPTPALATGVFMFSRTAPTAGEGERPRNGRQPRRAGPYLSGPRLMMMLLPRSPPIQS